MATTKNIGLVKFEGPDFVSREEFNANYDIIDTALGIDYVCERGKSGDWEWVKWNSGFMECWVADKAFPTQTFANWSGLSRTPAMNFGNFPIAFISTPLCFVTFNSAESAGFQSVVGYGQNTSTSKAPSFFLVDSALSGTTISTPHFGCYARGYYK